MRLCNLLASVLLVTALGACNDELARPADVAVVFDDPDAAPMRMFMRSVEVDGGRATPALIATFADTDGVVWVLEVAASGPERGEVVLRDADSGVVEHRIDYAPDRFQVRSQVGGQFREREVVVRRSELIRRAREQAAAEGADLSRLGREMPLHRVAVELTRHLQQRFASAAGGPLDVPVDALALLAQQIGPRDGEVGATEADALRAVRAARAESLRPRTLFQLATCGPDASIDAGDDAGDDAGGDASPDAEIDASPDAEIDASPDAEIDAEIDASPDAAPDAALDAAPDAAPDSEPDAAIDSEPDAAIDAAPDAAIDASLDACDAAPDAADAGLDAHGLDAVTKDWPAIATARRRLEGPGSELDRLEQLATAENPIQCAQGCSGATETRVGHYDRMEEKHFFGGYSAAGYAVCQDMESGASIEGVKVDYICPAGAFPTPSHQEGLTDTISLNGAHVSTDNAACMFLKNNGWGEDFDRRGRIAIAGGARIAAPTNTCRPGPGTDWAYGVRCSARIVLDGGEMATASSVDSRAYIHRTDAIGSMVKANITFHACEDNDTWPRYDDEALVKVGAWFARLASCGEALPPWGPAAGAEGGGAAD